MVHGYLALGHACGYNPTVYSRLLFTQSLSITVQYMIIHIPVWMCVCVYVCVFPTRYSIGCVYKHCPHSCYGIGWWEVLTKQIRKHSKGYLTLAGALTFEVFLWNYVLENFISANLSVEPTKGCYSSYRHGGLCSSVLRGETKLSDPSPQTKTLWID